LVPAQDESGESSPQLGISKAGNAIQVKADVAAS
jgi:hypothetical protein